MAEGIYAPRRLNDQRRSSVPAVEFYSGGACWSKCHGNVVKKNFRDVLSSIVDRDDRVGNAKVSGRTSSTKRWEPERVPQDATSAWEEGRSEAMREEFVKEG